ncbi:hypothetical protein Tco_1505663 [Tanacetum coccineum]
MEYVVTIYKSKKDYREGRRVELEQETSLEFARYDEETSCSKAKLQSTSLEQSSPSSSTNLQEEAAPAGEQSGPPAPKTAKQLTAKRNQKRVKSILLLAIPNEYLLKFHNVPDAKSLWATIKSTFGGNDESKRYAAEFLNLNIKGRYQSKVSKKSSSFMSQIALIMRNKPKHRPTDIEISYNPTRVYKDEMKRSLSFTSNSHNLAFLSFKNTSSTNEVSPVSGNFRVNTAGGTSSSSQVSSKLQVADEVVCSFFATTDNQTPLDHEGLQQINQDLLEE